MSTARPNPIVVGVDDSISSRQAVVYAAWEAERHGVPLRMVHGYLRPTPCLTQLAPLLDEYALLASARDRLAKTAQRVRSRRPALVLETTAVRASGADALVQESALASLVIVGKPHLGGFSRSPIGSVATQVVVNARCPVLVVPRSDVVPPPIPGAGPVLVGVDGSVTSEDVLEFGFEEAAARGVSLVAAHVWSVPEVTGLSAVGSGVEWDSDRDQAQIQLHETAERTLAEALAGWQERYPQVTVRRWVVHSFGTARVLLDIAHQVSAGLLVVGSRGRGAVAGAVFGSVSQVLISHAVVPIAVVGRLAGSSVGADLETARTSRE
jgi:nucleotide-binding universal stress UspA family protein